MPFQSKKQMAAAFGGYLGPEMKSKAQSWADETPNPKGLPDYAGSSKGKSYRVLRNKKQNRPA